MSCGFARWIVCMALLSPPAFAQSLVERAARDEVAFMSSEEPVMRAAYEKAGRTLDDFLKMAAKPPKGTTSIALKVAVTDGSNIEYFWVVDFSKRGDGFVGALNNEPNYVRKYKLGERFAFTRKQIVDWVYVDANGRMHGNFTACALLSKEEPEDAEEFQRQYGLKCE
jgi:uncharacterized protein YegJ (DUF2314 family)